MYGDFSQVDNDKCSTIIMQMLIVNDFQIPSSWEIWQMDYWPGTINPGCLAGLENEYSKVN